MKCICRFARCKTDNSNFDNMLYKAAPIDKSVLADTVNMHLCEVTQHIPVLDEGKLNVYRDNLPPMPSEYIVEVEEVQTGLSKIKLTKAVGPDNVSHKILKELATSLAPPVTSIINNSVRQGIVPDQWKLARITPIPKLYPPVNIESDLRPIAVTNSLAKIAEKFVSRHFNEYFDEFTDDNQFGCVRNRSTTHALLKIMHELFLASDSSQNIIRVLFVDFTKAFDVIDHNVLFNKFVNCGMPEHVVAWSMDFLCGRKQFVKLTDSVSSVSHATAGTPQGTVSGPNDFKLIINDLQFDIGYVKFVDDTTTFSVSNDPHNCLLQKAADYLVSWTDVNGMVINTSKTQEMVVYFGKQLCVDDIPLICINGRHIRRLCHLNCLV